VKIVELIAKLDALRLCETGRPESRLSGIGIA
jgi:hypothetical protein